MVLFADLREEDFALIHAPIDDLAFSAGQPLVLMGAAATEIYTMLPEIVLRGAFEKNGMPRFDRWLDDGWREHELEG